MQPLDLVTLFTSRFEQTQIEYMVTGSIACIIYGEPRLTHDIDLVVQMNTNQVEKLQRAFSEDEFYCPPKETLLINIQRDQRGSFNLIHHQTGFKADIYIAGNDGLQKWGLSKRKKIQIGREYIHIAPPEYVILKKLEFYREGKSEKHIRDISGILRKSSEIKASPELQRYLDELGLHREWNKVLDYLEKNL